MRIKLVNIFEYLINPNKNKFFKATFIKIKNNLLKYSCFYIRFSKYLCYYLLVNKIMFKFKENKKYFIYYNN